MPLLSLIIVLAVRASIAHGSHSTCRSGAISVSFETESAYCIEYCGTRFKLAEHSRVEIAMDACKEPDVFRADGTGPYPIPAERDSFGTAHVRLTGVTAVPTASPAQ